MVYTIICLIVFIINTIIKQKENKKLNCKYDSGDFLESCGWGALALVISFLLCALIIKPEFEIVNKREDIESLDVLSGVGGNFVLGAGNIRNQATYYYYIKDENNYYELKSLSGNIKIKQEGKDEAYIEIYEPKNIYMLLFWTFEKEYVIVVPENTIQKEFNANIK